MTVRHIDVPTAISDAFEYWESDMGQREDAVLLLSPKCRTEGDRVVFEFPDKTTAPVDSGDMKAWIEKHKPHLLPRKFEASLADQAFVGRGNATKMQKLVAEVGRAQADKIAQRYGKRNALDMKSIGTAPIDDEKGGNEARPKPDKAKNPWHDDSEAGQARRISVIKNLGTKVAAQLAKSAGKDIAGRPLRG